MNDLTTKLAEALELIAATDPIEAALDPQRAIRVAREALRLYDGAKAQPLKERPDFIAGYDAGLIDGRACERRDRAEAQPAQDEREAFEAWWPSVGQTLGKVAAWQAWQARAALAAYEAAQAEPVGEVVEMDDGCRVAVWRDGTPEPGTKLFAAPVAQAATPAPASHIKEPFTVQEIRERINSHDYSAEMLLQHAMLHLEQTQTCAATPAPARCANGPMGCDYPRCDCNGASTKESKA